MNFENLNLVELNAQERNETEGGFLEALAVGVAIYLVISTIEYPESFMSGLTGH